MYSLENFEALIYGIKIAIVVLIVYWLINESIKYYGLMMWEQWVLYNQ